MKVVSRTIIHKNAVGGIQIVCSREDIVSTATVIAARVAKLAPEHNIDGFLVEELVLGGAELLIGVSVTTRSGFTGLAIGGIFANSFKGNATCLLPLTDVRARNLVCEFSKDIGDTASGAALADVVTKVAVVAEAFGERLEVFDMSNPCQDYRRAGPRCSYRPGWSDKTKRPWDCSIALSELGSTA